MFLRSTVFVGAALTAMAVSGLPAAQAADDGHKKWIPIQSMGPSLYRIVGSQAAKYYKYKLKNVMVTAFNVNGSGASEKKTFKLICKGTLCRTANGKPLPGPTYFKNGKKYIKISLLLPAVQAAREAPRRTRSGKVTSVTGMPVPPGSRRAINGNSPGKIAKRRLKADGIVGKKTWGSSKLPGKRRIGVGELKRGSKRMIGVGEKSSTRRR